MSTPKKNLEFGSYHSPSTPPQASALPDSIRNEPNTEAELIDLKEHLISGILSELPEDPRQLSEHLPHWSFKDIRLLYDILSRNRNLVNTLQTRHLSRSHQLVIDSKIETLLEELKPLGVLIPEPDQVKSYLSQYPSLAEKLPDICAKVKTIPQNPAELSLEVKKRIESQEEVFTLYVRPSQYDDQLFNKLLDAMDEFGEWLSTQEGWIYVTTDFKSVRRG
ncbi:MAG TPA: hypothetical protein PKD57_14765 [Saprospiraceae bacterium]|nr:hypothetical protein [Saprospiraceae bacterium]